MKELTVEEYKQPKNGIYVYFKPECQMCKNYFDNLENTDTSQWFKVDCSQDEDFFISDGLEGMPHTRYYINDTVVWDKGGALFQFQIQQLLAFKYTRENRP